MKKYYFLIIVTLILGLVLTGCTLLSNISQVPATEQNGISSIAKNGLPSDSKCIDFEITTLSEGESIEGTGIVDSLLNIDLQNAGKSLILLKEGTDTNYIAYNTASTPAVVNGCLNGSYGFGCTIYNASGVQDITKGLGNGDKIVFTFPAGITVSSFSLWMFDYGDWYPSGGTVHEVKLSGNDGSYVQYFGPHPASNPGNDACIGVGKQKLEITGSGITEVTLEFVSGIDPGVGFDDVCFTIEPYTLTVNSTGNGSVSLDPSGGTYLPGTDVTLTPNAETGWNFEGWSGPDAGDLTDNGDGTYTITMDEDKEVSAIFTQWEVPVDIKPTSCPNPINTKSNGVIPVAILGTADFDVTLIDPCTVRLEGLAPIRWNLEDVSTPYEPYTGNLDCLDCNTEGPDGYLDLTLKFDTQELLELFRVESFEVSEEVLNALESGESDQVTTTNGDILVDGACLVISLVGWQMEEKKWFVGEDVVRILMKGKK